MSKERLPSGINFFQKYLTIWVALSMIGGVLIGRYLPAIPEFFNTNSYTHLDNDLSNDDEGGFSKCKKCREES